MKKFSSSLIALCLVVSILLLACSHNAEAAANFPPGSINAAYRRGMKKSEVTKQFHFDIYEFKKGGLSLKTHEMFSVHTRPGEVLKHRSF